MAFPKGYGADFLQSGHNFSTFGGVGTVKTPKKRTGSKKSIFDFISWLYFALKELDYKVTLSNRLCKYSTNLIFDNFYFDTGCAFK